LGVAGATLQPGGLAAPWLDANGASGAIVTIDHFGNLLTNLDAGLLADIDHPVVQVAGRELPLLRTYSDAVAGEYLALINSFGVVEVARSGASAAAGLQVERGAPIRVRPGSG
jgi:S-adenosylmethionine hydrolase